MTDRESAIYATGYWKGIEYKRQRELTDAEIIEVFKDVYNESIVPATKKSFDFARAILKKAREK
jgi:hypothetical protein